MAWTESTRLAWMIGNQPVKTTASGDPHGYAEGKMIRSLPRNPIRFDSQLRAYVDADIE